MAASWRTPTLIVIAGCLLTVLTFGTRAAFGLFLEPMSTAYTWDREVLAFALATQNLLCGAFQPAAGAVADRWGSGRVLAFGCVAYAVGVAAMAFSTTPTMLVITGGLIVGFALATSSFSLVLAAFGKLLPEEKRSWAFGIGTAAGSAGQFLVVPIGQGFIAAYGWQTALLLLGATLIIALPLCWWLQPQAGDAVPTGDSAPTVRKSLGQVLSDAARYRSYQYLIAGFFVCGFHVVFIAVHLPAYLTDLGFSPSLGAWSISLIGLFNIIGAYSAGIWAGKHSKKNLLSWIYFGRAVVIALFILLPKSEAGVLIFAALMGLLWLSTIPPTSGLVATMFGVRNLAMLFGVVFFSHQVGAFLGVWLGGRLFDLYGSYDIVWWLGVALGLFAAIIHWPIREQAAPQLQPA
ncbi:MAG: MFS transporter [Geminicoccaceae bacterium]